MRRGLIALAVFAVGCGGAADSSTTTTSPEATTLPAAETTTPQQVVEVQSCSSPPITFSTLCEIYELLEVWHVDRPLDPAAMASVVVEALQDFETEETETPPRTLYCAIPHQDFVPICDELGEQIDERQIPAGPAVEAAVSHMTDTALDPFTYYLPPEQAGNFRLNGIVGGIGVLLDARDVVGSKCARITEACELKVVTVLESNPGFEAGLAEGDSITHVDGQEVDGFGFASIIAVIAGDETGVVELTVERDGQTLEFTIERRELEFPTVEYAVPQPGVGYISIPDFEFDIPGLVDGALAEIGSVGTLVVDLRDNPGGFIDTLVDVADRFVNGGVVMISDGPDEHLEYTVNAGGSATGPRLIVLVNNGTASAAEILAGALRDRRGAVIVGSTTFGKDTVQIPFVLRNGGELYVAVARWSTPGGETVGQGGMTPDIMIDWPASTTVDDIVSLALDAAS